MKKQNKSDLVFFLILFGAIFLLCGIVLIISSTKSEFNIYQEECENESYWHMYDNFIQVSWNVSYPLTANEKIECGENTCYTFYKDYTEKCKKVEVDEIEISTGLLNCVGTLTDFPGTINETFIEKNCVEDFQSISKQDLTIEWLEDNCECINSKNIAWYNWDCNQNYFVSTKTHSKPYEGCEFHRVVSDNDECSEYKCSEYFVEVK